MLSANGCLVEGGQERSDQREESNMQLVCVCQLGESVFSLDSSQSCFMSVSSKISSVTSKHNCQ